MIMIKWSRFALILNESDGQMSMTYDDIMTLLNDTQDEMRIER